jgi:hypothetical protein
MPQEIKESDWKVFKQLHEVALERYFIRAVAEIERVIGEKGKSNRDRFWDTHTLIEEHRETLRRTFDDFRRSTALMQLAFICALELLKPDELARLSPEAQDYLRQLAELRARQNRDRAEGTRNS